MKRSSVIGNLRTRMNVNVMMTLQKDDSCRVYRTEFYEAAVTHQNITHCEEGDMRQSTLKVIDAEINPFNDLIATYCSD